MKITRHNYEEYFVLYLDNELGSGDRRQVDLFVLENADLKNELDWLKQSRLVPDASVVFDNKEQLMKASGIGSINIDNYEEWLLLYTDNELSAEQKIDVEQFAASDSAIKTSLDILQKTKLQAEEDIVFPNKEILYRKEEKVRVVAIRWWKIAVAAALFIAISTTAFIVLNKKNITKEALATRNLHVIKSTPENSGDQQKGATTTQVNPKATENSNYGTEKEAVIINNTVAIKDKKNIPPKEKNIPPFYLTIKDKMPAIVNTNKEKKKTNDLPQPTYNPNVNGVVEQNNPMANIDPPVKGSLTNPKETNGISSVTPNSSQPLYNVIAAASKESDDPIDAEQPGRKNKFRGFFRKITRTFEKNTNIKATDDEDRLLLGGLAIKL